VCHKGTVRLSVVLLTAGLAVAFAQTAQDWRKIGGSGVELFLASPATGPVDHVWYSPGGSVLFARTHSGRVFQTADYESWSLADPAPEPPLVARASAIRLPEIGARILAAGADGSRIYALGRQLFRSDDGGRTWANLTAWRSQAVIGDGQHSVAVSPADPDQLVVANNYGVWRSTDGGLSWTGINQGLPNLTVRRILSAPNGTHGTRILSDQLGVLELTPGASVWTPVPTPAPDAEALLRQKYSPVVGADLSAVTQAGNVVYAGSSDGRLWVSFDGGATFRNTQAPGGTSGRVERIFVDSAEPRVAVAALSGPGNHVLRTTQFGNFWDVLDNNLPDTSVRSVTAERSTGAIYAATDKGVFWTRTDLENASSPAVTWTALSRLPAAGATDVLLNPAGVQLYVALDGYGVFATAAPHRQRSLRIVNGGDFSTRPAAPGSLLSVIGSRVNSARGGDLNYPVLAASDNESQIQVPFNVVGNNIALSLLTPDGTFRRDLPLQPVSPSIMINREGAPMLWDADSGLPLDVKNVARSNGRLQIWATGLGRVRPDWPAGLPAPHENPPSVVASIKVFLDGAPLLVTQATLVPDFVGFYLIEVQLPSIVNAGTSVLSMTADNQESNKVPLFIEP
jgi:uncharacterized protein (TIGR03437 family)